MYQPADEEELIRDSARRAFASDYDLGFVRSYQQEPERYGPELLALIREMGWQSLIVPEEHGGVGYGFGELCGLLQEHGFAAMPPLFFAHFVAPVLCLSAVPGSDRSWELLQNIAEGRCIPCVSADSATLSSFSSGNTVQAETAKGSYTLSGTVSKLVSAGSANLFLVPAQLQDRTLLLTVDAGDSSLQLTPHYDKSFGQTSELTFNNTVVSEDYVIADDAGDALQQIYRLCAVAKSAEMIGGAERAMRFAVDHITTRKQFGKTLAEFQAVQHQAADMLKSVAVARLFLDEATQLIVTGQPLGMAAHNCKCWANQASFRVTGTSHQLMGGTGYMMETDLHLLTLQGLRNEYEFGSTDHHRDMIADMLGL